MARITVLGGGFAAVAAVGALRRADPGHEVTLVAPRDRFLFAPSLIWLPTGLRDAAAITRPLEPFVHRHGAAFVQATVTGLEDGGRTVLTDGGIVENDALVIATGGRFLQALPGSEHALTLCAGTDSAGAMGDRLADLEGGTIAFGFSANPKEPQAVRGGPMFELLFGIDTHLRRQRRRRDFRLVFFSPAARPGARLGEKAVDRLLARMERHGVETHLGHKLLRFDERQVVTEGGAIPAEMILFMPGMTGPAWAADAGLPLSEGGFIQADAHCAVPGWDNVWVAGDAGSYPGPGWMPKQAHMAELQARTAARNAADALAGGAADARFRTELVCIIDSLDRGALVYRTEKRQLMLPPMRALHWAKRAFERRYLRRFG